MCAEGLRRKFRNHIDEYVNNNYKRAGRILELNHGQSKMTEASKDYQPKMKRRRGVIKK